MTVVDGLQCGDVTVVEGLPDRVVDGWQCGDVTVVDGLQCVDVTVVDGWQCGDVTVVDGLQCEDVTVVEGLRDRVVDGWQCGDVTVVDGLQCGDVTVVEGLRDRDHSDIWFCVVTSVELRNFRTSVLLLLRTSVAPLYWRRILYWRILRGRGHSRKPFVE